ncbi:MAG TPA: sensor histidine kinase [Ornithinibacter sp.]|nr:sensor histidine kinase [Ornithinibacter sp.]
MAVDALRSLWVEPRSPNPPARGRRDWALVAAFACWTALEAALRQDAAPRVLWLVAAVAAVAPLPWRREHPFGAAAVAFGLLTAVDVVRILTRSHGVLPSSVSATLVLTYALFRWGSGRGAAGGLGVILVWLVVTNVADPTSLTDTLAAYGFFLFAAALGAAVRYRARIRVRDVDEAKAREREQLARELHDTVAHHVSGIAIQAQAGRAVAATDPERAIEALATIEDAATRTLTELRAIVGVLRASQRSELAPQPGVAELGQLMDDGQRPGVEVVLAGDLHDLSPAVGAAIYRLAQESVTNARRHARHATRVTVTVTGDADRVQLTVDDDGSSAAAGRASGGYGLVGMRERVSLLGGTFHAGPAAGRGWHVEATLPRTAATR